MLSGRRLVFNMSMPSPSILSGFALPSAIKAYWSLDGWEWWMWFMSQWQNEWKDTIMWFSDDTFYICIWVLRGQTTNLSWRNNGNDMRVEAKTTSTMYFTSYCFILQMLIARLNCSGTDMKTGTETSLLRFYPSKSWNRDLTFQVFAFWILEALCPVNL